MRQLLAIAVLLGTSATASAVDIDSDYRAYFEEVPAVADQPKPKSLRKRAHPAETIDKRRYETGSASKDPDPLKPGYRNAAGFYVPPAYSTHPGNPTGPNDSPDESYGRYGATNPFGGLGTRR